MTTEKGCNICRNHRGRWNYCASCGRDLTPNQKYKIIGADPSNFYHASELALHRLRENGGNKY